MINRFGDPLHVRRACARDPAHFLVFLLPPPLGAFFPFVRDEHQRIMFRSALNPIFLLGVDQPTRELFRRCIPRLC